MERDRAVLIDHPPLTVSESVAPPGSTAQFLPSWDCNFLLLRRIRGLQVLAPLCDPPLDLCVLVSVYISPHFSTPLRVPPAVILWFPTSFFLSLYLSLHPSLFLDVSVLLFLSVLLSLLSPHPCCSVSTPFSGPPSAWCLPPLHASLLPPFSPGVFSPYPSHNPSLPLPPPTC